MLGLVHSAATSAQDLPQETKLCETVYILANRYQRHQITPSDFFVRHVDLSRAGLPGISAAVLTQRLAGLESAGVAVRRKLPPPASVQVYDLTAWGRESEPIFAALGRWAARSPTHDPTLPFSPASLLLSLRTMLDADKARGLDLRIGFRLGEESFAGRLAGGAITIARDEPSPADFVFSGSAGAVAAAIYGGRSFADLEAAGALRVDGDRAKAQTFAGLFPLPARASMLVNQR